MGTRRMGLPKPKRLKGGAKIAPEGVQKLHGWGRNFCTHKSIKENREKERETKGNGKPLQHVSKTLKQARERIIELKKARKEVVEELKEVRVLRQMDLAKYWRELVVAKYPSRNILPLTTAARAALWHKQKAYNIATNNSGDTFASFLAQVVDSWVGMLTTEFHWMSNIPELPDAWFVVTHFDRIFRAWETRRNQWLVRLPVAQVCKPETVSVFTPRIGKQTRKPSLIAEDYNDTDNFGTYEDHER